MGPEQDVGAGLIVRGGEGACGGVELLRLDSGDKSVLQVTEMFVKEVGRSVHVRAGSAALLYDVLASNFQTLAFGADGRISFDYALAIDGEQTLRRYCVQTVRERDIRRVDTTPPVPTCIRQSQESPEESGELAQSNHRIAAL